MELETLETKQIYVVWINTDNTEGRGYQMPRAYATHKSTALRLAKGKGVQGTDAEIRPFTAVRIEGNWCAPVSLQAPTKEEEKEEARLEEVANLKKKVLSLGITEEELKILGAK